MKEVTGIQRDGVNLYSNVTINYIEAILGTQTQVRPTSSCVVHDNVSKCLSVVRSEARTFE